MGEYPRVITTHDIDHLATKLELTLLEDKLELQVKMLEMKIFENRVLCDSKEKIDEVKSVLDHICPGSFETMSNKNNDYVRRPKTSDPR